MTRALCSKRKSLILGFLNHSSFTGPEVTKQVASDIESAVLRMPDLIPIAEDVIDGHDNLLPALPAASPPPDPPVTAPRSFFVQFHQPRLPAGRQGSDDFRAQHVRVIAGALGEKLSLFHPPLRAASRPAFCSSHGSINRSVRKESSSGPPSSPSSESIAARSTPAPRSVPRAPALAPRRADVSMPVAA